jgi:uracil-DNA glycosylase family 4
MANEPLCNAKLVPNARIALVGECADDTDIAEGKPFTGSSGRILTKMMNGAQLKLEDCTLNYVVKEACHRGDVSSFYKDPKQLEPTPKLREYRERLKKELSSYSSYKPNLAVAVGEEALRSLTGLQNIQKYRGSILPSSLVPGLKVIPVLRPSFILQGQWKYFWIGMQDFQRVRKESTSRVIKPLAWNSIINPQAKDVVAFFNSIKAEDLWCIDIETRAGYIACFSVSSGSTALCVPLQNTCGVNYFAGDEARIWRALQNLMTRCPKLIGQNLSFDLDYLMDRGLEPSGIFMDTMIAHSILHPEFPKGLDFLASIYTLMPYYKDEGKTWNSKVPDRQLWEYNNKDTITTLWAALEIEKELKQRKLHSLYHDYVNVELGLALEMQRLRLPVSEANRTELSNCINAALTETCGKWNGETLMEKLAAEQVRKKPNVGSSKQVCSFLYNDLGLKPKYKWGTQTPRADEDAIMELRAEYPDVKELKWILEERHLRKLRSSYIDVARDEDGRLPGAWYVCGTETGRWSSGKSNRGRGTNLQTIPKPLRHMVVPPEGYIFVQPDLSQAEARMVAYLAGCERLIGLFNDTSKNIHMENGKAIFGSYPVKDSPDYVLAKACVHASNYRMQAKTFSVQAGILLRKAAEVLEGYHATYPEIRQWHQHIRDEVFRTGRLVTPFGRERLFYTARAEIMLTGKMGNDAWREALAYKPQATIPDIVNKAMIQLWEEIPEARFFHQGHDAFLCAVPVEMLSVVATAIKKYCTMPIEVEGIDGVTRTLTIPAETACGYSWLAMKGWDGEETLTKEEWETWAAKKYNFNAIKEDLLHTK